MRYRGGHPQTNQADRKGDTVKKFVWFAIALFLIVFNPALTLTAQEDGWEEIFVNSNKAYRDGRFNDAARGYLSLISSGQKNGHIYYNLGTSCYRMGELGRAVLNYERASLLIPGDADLKFNLNYVEEQTLDVISQPQGFMDMVFAWLNSLSFPELLWWFAGLNFFFSAIILFRLFYKAEWVYYLFLIFAFLWVISGISFCMKWYQVESDERAVILDKEVSVLAGPDSGDIVLFKLHEGAIVHYERSEGKWSLICLSGEKRGWVKKDAVECIKGCS